MSIKLSPEAMFLFNNLKEGKKKLRKVDEGFKYQNRLLTNQKFLLATIHELIDKKAIDFKTSSGIFGKKGELIITREDVELETKNEGA